MKVNKLELIVCCLFTCLMVILLACCDDQPTNAKVVGQDTVIVEEFWEEVADSIKRHR